MNMLVLAPNVVQQLSLSFSKSLSSIEWQNKSKKVLSLTVAEEPCSSSVRRTVIRMGGGPRTYPGGVSKWQWKRMQAKKAKQLLKARLCRERQIYEMRKRAELKAAVSELEKPWEVVEKAPKLLSVSADEQVKVLADRFQKPGGFDLWTEKDGPQLFQTPDELPSARFFPKGVVHSIKPYRKVSADDLVEGPDFPEDDAYGDGDGDGGWCSEDVGEGDGEGGSSSRLNYGRNGGNVGRGLRKNGNGNGRRLLSENVVDWSDDGENSSQLNRGRDGLNVDGRMRKNGNGRKFFPEGVDGSDNGESSSPLDRRRNGASFDGKIGNKGSARRILSKDGVRSDGSSDNRLRRKENGRRYMSKDFDGPKGMYAGRDGSGRKQRGSNSVAGRSYGKYTRRTSDYATPRVRDADSEVYDMDLQQDGSYGFLQKSQQSDPTSW